ncbi:MAG: GWxTD domain-containing protein, partial [Candidatus Latescibacteria bacterium]|nr:GWxTD domain-containing protein [Candidatus Latescibacterota bacterium]
PVYLELADWYVNNNFEMYHGEIRLLYEKYLRLRPDDVEVLYGLAVSYTEEHSYRSVVEIGETALAKNPGEARLLALLAQAYAGLGDPDRALELFAQYFDAIPAEERALYKDLQLVAKPEELKVYESLPEEERAAFLVTFWRKRDLTLFSGGLAREAEHYRRVWFVRTHFAKGVQPWDRRGEVFIRNGEPDYRSRSHAPNAVPSAEAEAVKERLALDIVGGFVEFGEMTEELFFRRTGEDTEEQELEDDKQAFEYSGGNLIEPVYPVKFNERSVPWESWIYTQVGGGVEFVFVDELLNGKWQFPSLPDGTR